MKNSLTKILRQLERIDPITGFPQCMLLGFSDTYSQSEHLARYLFARNHEKGFILDVAAGSCYGSSILAEDELNYVVSADLNITALLYGKAVFRPKKNMEAICCDAGYLPFRNASFDTIVSIETLEHLQDPSLFLREIKRVMKSFGLIILSTPNKNVTSPVLFTPLNPYHCKEYELRGITCMLESQGMKTIAVFYQTRISLFQFFARAIGIFLVFLLMKLKISFVPLRNLLKAFRFQRNKLLDPNPSLYPISKYSRILDCLTHFQLVIIAQKSENG